MQTMIDLEPEAYRLAETLALQEHTSVGKVLGDALLERFQSLTGENHRVVKGPLGLPEIYLGRTVTAEEVAAAIEES